MAKKRRRPKKSGGIKISLDRQLDILGIFLMALAGITVLSFLSATRGSLTEWWLHLLQQGFGWGVYVVPFGMGAVGFWLLVRHFESRPEISREKTVGAVLLFLTVLAAFHLFSFPDDPELLAVQGGGGGYLGWLISQTLVSGIGKVGAFVVVLALMITAFILLSGLSTVEMGQLIRSGWLRLVDLYRYRFANFKQRPSPAVSEEEPQQRFIERFIPSAAGPGGDQIEPSPQPPLSAQRGALLPRIIGGPSPEWRLPPIGEILEDSLEQEISQAEIRAKVKIIEETLASFGVVAKVVEVNQGPTVTQFGLEPGYVERKDRSGRIKRVKIKVSKISSLANDLALALAASPIRIEAPVPGRPIVGIEVPNSEPSLVALGSVVETETFRQLDSKLKIALGQDVSGQAVVADLATMPHLLIAGATGSGKSVCINSIVTCLLCHNTPDALRLLMVDPKMVELTNYNGIPHLIRPVVVELEEVVKVLHWTTKQMDRRYHLFAEAGSRNIENHNESLVARGKAPLPYIVVVIDELADLMMVSPDEVERSICRIAQMARATGIHLVIATQRPSVDVVTGLIKANFPARISFAVASQVDSRVVLDMVGAERLLGRGDMLYMAPDSSKLVRLQGCFVSDRELNRLVHYWKGIRVPQELKPEDVVQQPLWADFIAKEEEAAQTDDLLDKAIEVVRKHNRASISLLQRRLRIGYSRAARLIDIMEEQGIIGPEKGGGRGRRVLTAEREEAGGAPRG
jgi:S-DNA-T family DNA segregation ATPase FtsK/SpoIIIE